MSETPAVLRVMVVDDHPLMRRGMVGVLEESAGILVVAEAGDGFAAQAGYLEHRPDVTLMDLSMPRCGGIEAIQAIRREDPAACIVAVSTYAGDGQVHRALEAGAAGYVLKSELRSGLGELVRTAHAGCRVLAPELARRLAAGKPERLTARELGLAEETVKSYLSNVLQKLQASDRTHAVVIALRRGMLD